MGYNPLKPGRPSHTYHTYQMAGLRLVLGVTVEAGNHSHSNTTLPGLLRLIDRLPIEQRPYCVRGDAGFGHDAVMTGLEERTIPYLLKLRATKNVKRFVEQVFWRQGWTPAGDGFEGREGELALSGWQKARRVIVLRRRLKGEVVLSDKSPQLALGFLEADEATGRYEYFVLVTSLPHEIRTVAQLYRDRADSENTFDELFVVSDKQVVGNDSLLVHIQCGLQVDDAGEVGDVVLHHVHADAAAGHRCDRGGGGQARAEDEAVDLLLAHPRELGLVKGGSQVAGAAVRGGIGQCHAL